MDARFVPDRRRPRHADRLIISPTLRPRPPARGGVSPTPPPSSASTGRRGFPNPMGFEYPATRTPARAGAGQCRTIKEMST